MPGPGAELAPHSHFTIPATALTRTALHSTALHSTALHCTALPGLMIDNQKGGAVAGDGANIIYPLTGHPCPC